MLVLEQEDYCIIIMLLVRVVKSRIIILLWIIISLYYYIIILSVCFVKSRKINKIIDVCMTMFRLFSLLMNLME